MSLLALKGGIELGLIYGLVALGLFISFRLLNIADLTVDSSFTLGAAAVTIFTLKGQPLLGLLIAILLGGAAGYVTAFLHTKLKVQAILAGIITMTGLYSINLLVMGNRSNLGIPRNTDTLYTFFDSLLGKSYGKLAFLLIVIALICFVLILFMRTRLGLSLRATGDNIDMVRSSSINPNFTISVGLVLANALVALAGALLAHYQLSCDIGMGTGIVIVGLASLVIGEVIVGTKSMPRCITGAVLGAIIYRIIMAVALAASISASLLKLFSAIFVAAAISYPAIKEQIEFRKLRKAGAKNA